MERQVQSGFYHSSSEVIQAALPLLVKFGSENNNTRFEDYKMWLNQEVQIGLDQAARGELIDGEKALQNLRAFRKEQLKLHGTI